jgi:hypothetical protein
VADSYLTISTIANDSWMQERLRACATQQAHLGGAPGITDPVAWTIDNRYLWAASPGWAEQWDSGVVAHAGDIGYQPGRDAAVITDGNILSTVQSLGAN